ncbi:MAG: diguanylate cyclase [Clostridia bacterium]|nr:diguanylate cyclase [Clostridia bacterium]
MEKILKTIRNYFCYCGIEKEEYKAIKRDTFISNYRIWRILHCLMTVFFAALFIDTLVSRMMRENSIVYLLSFVYSALVTFVFFKLKKDSVIAQILIYLSIMFLFVFSSFITQNNPKIPATTFFVMLVITPMFMIDRPYFMGMVLTVASTGFATWMYFVKPYKIWELDFSNLVIFYPLGIVLHVVSNSVRIREFVLRRKINIQKDTDETTGLKNKGALTRAIDKYLKDETKEKGILFVSDIDQFKKINDTYGHDIGDRVIGDFGKLLKDYFKNDEIVGRFGGDEFIIFIKNTDNGETALNTANEIVTSAAEQIEMPDENQKFSISIGIALYRGVEKNYTELFKKADMALYKVKSDPDSQFTIYEN